MSDALRAGLLLAGFAALLIAPFVVPRARTRAARDPHAAAVKHLLAVEPGMRRSVLESHLRFYYRRQDGVEVFTHPDSDLLCLEVRLDGPGENALVTAVGDPHLAPFPQPNHLR